MVAECVVLFGFLVTLIGALSMLRPIRRLSIRSRAAGLAVFVIGLGLVAGGELAPARRVVARDRDTLLTAALPVYQFHEVHSIRVRASPDRVFRAFEEVRGRDIPTLATLLWLRSLPERMMGRARARSPVPGYAVTDIVERSGASRAFTIADSGARVVSVSGREIVLRYASRPPARAVEPDSILRAYAAALARSAALRVWRSDSDSATFRIGAGPRAIWIEVAVGGDGSTYAVDIMRPDDLLAAPILETLSMSGLGVLAREANREIVLGAVNRSEGAGGGEAAPRFGDLAAFAAYDPPGVSKIAFNLRIVELGDGTSKVVTETRVLATDAAARRAFGAYWRLIHPGSALIRVMWLRAIRARAEATP